MGAVVCPTVTATNLADYKAQVKVLSPFAKRVHIDLMDGEFAPTVSPNLKDIWWPPHFTVDIHIMYQRPMDYVKDLIHLQPNMVVFHMEAALHYMHMAAELHKEGIKVGLAILPATTIASIEKVLHSFDHLLIFSGDLGHFGGHANLDLLAKIKEAKAHHPDLEIGWDGGINADNVRQLVDGGVDVLNVGGFIQKADDPHAAYQRLVDLL